MGVSSQGTLIIDEVKTTKSNQNLEGESLPKTETQNLEKAVQPKKKHKIPILDLRKRKWNPRPKSLSIENADRNLHDMGANQSIHSNKDESPQNCLSSSPYTKATENFKGSVVELEKRNLETAEDYCKKPEYLLVSQQSLKTNRRQLVIPKRKSKEIRRNGAKAPTHKQLRDAFLANPLGFNRENSGDLPPALPDPLPQEESYNCESHTMEVPQDLAKISLEVPMKPAREESVLDKDCSRGFPMTFDIEGKDAKGSQAQCNLITEDLRNSGSDLRPQSRDNVIDLISPGPTESNLRSKGKKHIPLYANSTNSKNGNLVDCQDSARKAQALETSSKFGNKFQAAHNGVEGFSIDIFEPQEHSVEMAKLNFEPNKAKITKPLKNKLNESKVRILIFKVFSDIVA